MRILSNPSDAFPRTWIMPFISHMNFRTAIAAQVAVLVALCAAGAREFRVAETQAEDYPTVLALQFMARVVEERTAARHPIRVFHSRQLGEEKETIEQTRVGAIDLNRTNVAPIGSLIPAANVLALPFLFRSFRGRAGLLCRFCSARSIICTKCSIRRSARRSWRARSAMVSSAWRFT